MRRREFIALLSSGVAGWPLAALAQQPTSTIRRVGFLLPGVARTTAVRGLLEAFREGLKEYGWVEGQNISVEYRFAGGKKDALPGIAAALVQSRLDVIVAEGTAAIRAAKNVTRTVPIVMAVSNDPVGTGLVASLNRPGGNITGLSILSQELISKRLQLLTEIIPGLARVAVFRIRQIRAAPYCWSKRKQQRNRLVLRFMSRRFRDRISSREVHVHAA